MKNFKLTKAICFITVLVFCFVCLQGISAAHVSCGDTIMTDTTLDEDLTCTGDGLTIGSNNITVDGNGHELINVVRSGTGVKIFQNQYVTIKNLKITNFQIGINIFDSGYTNLEGNKLKDNNSGIVLSFTSNSTITDNEVTSNVDPSNNGISLFTSSYNTLTNNIVASYNFGIRLVRFSNQNMLSGNTVVSSINRGIHLVDASDWNTFKENNILFNLIAGLSIERNSNFLFPSNNTFFNNNFIINGFASNGYGPDPQISGGSNIFSLTVVEGGGNFWSHFDEPSEGCNDANNDDFCDSPFIFIGGQDNLPLTTLVLGAFGSSVQLIPLVNSIDLPVGLLNSLILKLEKAQEALDDGKVNVAINKLNAFINQVTALMNAGLIPQALGQLLIDVAQGIIDQLS